MSKIEITAADVTTYKTMDRRTGRDLSYASITTKAGRRFMDDAVARLPPDVPSKLNPTGTNRQINEVLSHGLDTQQDETPMHFLVARNIVKHCGLGETKWKEIWAAE